jgi:hypothetical protein
MTHSRSTKEDEERRGQIEQKIAKDAKKEEKVRKGKEEQGRRKKPRKERVRPASGRPSGSS